MTRFRRRPRYFRLWPLVTMLLLLAVFLLAEVSKPGRSIVDCSQSGLVQDKAFLGELRVLSLNVLHGHPDFLDLEQRLEHIAAEIDRLGADIVLLQEVPWTPDLGSGAEFLARLTGLNCLYLRANGNRGLIRFEEGAAILSRFSLVDAQLTELMPRAGFFEHRVVLGATVEMPSFALPVFVTHLTNGDPGINSDQAAFLHRFVSSTTEGPAIVAGDFNATQDEPQMFFLSSNWLDTYRSLNPGEAGFTCCVGNLRNGPDEPLEKRIDYLFLVDGVGLRLKDARVVFNRPFVVPGGYQWASDHLGLLAIFQID